VLFDIGTVASAQVIPSAIATAVIVCKTVPYHWSMHKTQKAARSSRRLTDLLTRLAGTG
jgi:hypothetical protein